LLVEESAMADGVINGMATGARAAHNYTTSVGAN